MGTGTTGRIGGGERASVCTEFNVEQLMQLLRCVAAAVVVVVASAARHADKAAGLGGKGEGAGCGRVLG